MATSLLIGSLAVGSGNTVDAAPVGPGFAITVADLQFILQQIRIAEAHATREGENAGQVQAPTSPIGQGANDIPDPRLPWGLRQVDGRNNNLMNNGWSRWTGRAYNSTSGNSAWGSADQTFPRLTAAFWRSAEDPTTGFPGPWASSYDPQFRTSSVQDSQPRLASNLVSDQTKNNPAAVQASGTTGTDVDGSLLVRNVATNAGVAAPTNGMFVLFGQFFDHGLDLVGKTGTENVVVPLLPGDPLYVAGSPTNFMIANRTVLNGNGDGTNTTTPWIDQNQTYTSHPSHQVFLREYARPNGGAPVATGLLLDGSIPGNIANWTEVKAQARDMLGIALVDTDVFDVPLLLTDEYGRFLRGANGYPQLVQSNGSVVEGNPAAPISTAAAMRTGHSFLDDIAHTAVPSSGKTPDPDTDTGNAPPSGTYDDELLGRHFITGDGRGNENIGLTAVHTVFHAEHNRLVKDIQNVITTSGAFAAADWNLASGAWNGERLFQAARFVNEMEYQHLVFGEFVRTFQPAIKPFVAYDPTLRPDITAEFAHAVYRFGHSQLTGKIDRVSATGADIGSSLFDAFLNPTMFNSGGMDGYQAAGAVARGMTKQIGNEIDEFVTDTLRNKLVGLPLDLGTLNMVRGRDTGTGSLNQVRRALFKSTGNSALAPYESWFDFGFALRHPASLVNFVAAYGTHPSITASTDIATRRAAADLLVNGGTGAPLDRSDFFFGTNAWSPVNGIPTTGLESVDLWLGGLAEERPVFAAGMLGSTFDYVFTKQMENLQEGDRFYYLGRLAGLPLLNEMETNFFSEIIMRNTDAEALPANVFFYPAQTFMMNGTPPAGIFVGADGTWRYGGRDHVVFNGTAGKDRAWSSSGDDTLRGNDADDWLQGDMGNDFAIGGLGNDIINDSSGVDSLIGGDGDDVITSGGVGLDALLGGAGNDFMRGGTDATAMTGSRGNDIALGGTGNDGVTGDDGTDWMDGASGNDSLTGDLVSPFGLDLGVPGDDVLVGGSGNDLLDGGGQMDVSVAGVGQDTFLGGFGFDWQTYYDPNSATATAANADLNLFAPLPGDILAGLQDGFQDVEALSGGTLADTLRGDIRTTLTTPNVRPTDILNSTDIPKIAGLDQLLAGATTWASGNILIGGPGGDTFEGRAGDDFIDGDAWLEVFLSIPPTPGVTGIVDPATNRTLVRNATDLYGAVANGTLKMADITVERRISRGMYANETDTAILSGVSTDYDITFPSPGVVRVSDRVAGRDGVDTLRNVERLRFTLGGNTLNLPVPSPVRSVTTTSPSPTSLAVSWQAPAYTSGGQSITGYTVNAFNSTTSPTLLATCSTSSLTCNLTGLTTWQPYYLEITARATATVQNNTRTIDGVPTERIRATPGVVPGTPSGVTGQQVDPTTMQVRWIAPTSDGGSPIIGYTVRAFDAATGGNQRSSCTTTGALSCNLIGLTTTTPYYVDVLASNVAGASAPTARVMMSTTGPPSAPRNVRIVGKNTSLDVTWTVPQSTGGSAITGYTARAFATVDGTSPVGTCVPATLATLACTIPGLVNGKSYSVDVVATNANGDGPASSPRVTGSPVATPMPPGAPTDVRVVTTTQTSLQVAWTAPTSTGTAPITGYTARAYNQNGSLISSCSPASLTTLSCVISGLTVGTTYNVRVIATNSVGNSPESVALSASTQGPSVPDPPRIQTPSPGSGRMQVNWLAPLWNGGTAITGYTAQAWVNNNGVRGAMAGSCSTNGGGTNCTIRPLNRNTGYLFTVYATNAQGNSLLSTAVLATTN